MPKITAFEKEDPSESLSETRSGVPVLRTLYFFYFAAFGIVATFLNVYYRDSGLSGFQIGILSFVLPLISMIAAPLWGILSDRFGRVRYLLMLAGGGVIIAIGGIGLTDAFVGLVLFTILFAFFDSSVLTILDSTTLRSLGKNRERFGRERVWGSLGFIFSVWGVGFILQKIGSNWFFMFYILMILAEMVVLFWLPNHKAELKPASRGGVYKLVFEKNWLIFSLSLMLIGLGSFAINGFLGIYIKELGGSEGLIGTAAALATVMELPILFWGEKILKRYTPRQLLLVAFSATAIRLVIYGVMPSATWVIPTSILHSLSFGLFWIATVAYVDQLAGDEIKSTAQGMLYAVLNISRMIAALLSGYLYDIMGAGNLFLISAGLTVFAVVLIWFNKPPQNELQVKQVVSS